MMWECRSMRRRADGLALGLALWVVVQVQEEQGILEGIAGSMHSIQ